MSKIIMTGGGSSADLDAVTAAPADVLAGKVIVGADGDPAAGTMPNNGGQSAALNCGQSKTIPAGYTSGGTVTANSLASQTGATATAAQILTGKTAWVNGNRLTGTMVDYSYLITTHIPFDGSTLSGVLKDGVLIRTNDGHGSDVNNYFYGGGKLSVTCNSPSENAKFEIWPKYSINLKPYKKIRIKGRAVPSAATVFGYAIYGAYRNSNNKWSFITGGSASAGSTSNPAYTSGETLNFDVYIDVNARTEEGGFRAEVYKRHTNGNVTMYIDLIQFIA